MTQQTYKWRTVVWGMRILNYFCSKKMGWFREPAAQVWPSEVLQNGHASCELVRKHTDTCGRIMTHFIFVGRLNANLQCCVAPINCVHIHHAVIKPTLKLNQLTVKESPPSMSTKNLTRELSRGTKEVYVAEIRTFERFST